MGRVPAGEHWAVVRLVRVTIPGDERSRQAPGHGYPEHTEEYSAYEPCKDRADMEARLSRSAPGEARGIHVTETFATEDRRVVRRED